MKQDETFPLERFHQVGVCILRQAVEQTLLADLHQRATAIRAWAESGRVSGLRRVGNNGHPDSSVIADDGNTWGVNEVTRQACHDPRITEIVSHGAIGEAVETLIPEPRPWGLKLLWAPRHQPYHLGWHRDVPWHLDGAMGLKPAAQDHLQYNVALADDTAFTVVPGSQRRPLQAHEIALLTNNRRSPLPGAQRIHLAAGDVLIMDAHALHCGEAAAGSPRLTLHYSVQAQWVPLCPWGQDEDFAWICSQSFRDGLHPRCAHWYERLLSAQRAESQYGWLEAHARSLGWSGRSPCTEALCRRQPPPAYAT